MHEQASPQERKHHVYRHWNGRSDYHYRLGRLDAAPPLTTHAAKAGKVLG
jgi:hypothetical protein